MKKLLAKIIGATTALAMAIGVGVAAGNNKTKITKVEAAEGDEVAIFESSDVVSNS